MTSSDPLLAGTGGNADNWFALWLFNLYRTVLAGLFAGLFLLGAGPQHLGRTDPELYRWVGILYLAVNLSALVTNHLRRPPFLIQSYLLMALDIAALTLLMHASGGLRSGLGMLILTSIAAGGLLVAGRMALLFAALAALAVLAEQVYGQWTSSFDTTYYTQGGMLGAAFFATALLAQGLARRVRESEALAAQRGVDLANLEQLNAHIIRHFDSGIVVVDGRQRVRLMNEAAQRLLGVTGCPAGGCRLGGVSAELAERFHAWLANPRRPAGPFRPAGEGIEVLPRFSPLGGAARAGTLIFLEDTAAGAERARQIKLAALGRLTASIAHEVRNPLGAISHAGQLLAESEQLERQDRRLTEIINKQSLRVNAIIDNVLQLSRRDRIRPETIELGPWLDGLVAELGPDSAGKVELAVAAGTTLFADPTQLHQVVANLLDNALRHADPLSPRVTVETGGGERGPWLEVCDNGGGIDSDTRNKIFEPFFTTRAEGSGLGLYIARELCEANQAHLDCRPATGGGSCFRIQFAEHGREIQ